MPGKLERPRVRAERLVGRYVSWSYVPCGPIQNPYETLGAFLCQNAVSKSDASRPEVTNFFEVNRRVARIGLEQGEVLVCQLSNVIG